MMLTSHVYRIPAAVHVHHIKDTLCDHLPMHLEPASALERTFLDTFDWRLYEAGMELEAFTVGSEVLLQLRSLDSGAALTSLRCRGLPQFIWDLPRAPLRARLEAVIEMRALLRQVSVASDVQTLKWLNKDGKTLLRLELEESQIQAQADRSAEHSLQSRLRVVPYKGYDKPLKQALQVVEQRLGLRLDEQTLMVEALRRLGREPADYSSKLTIRLDPAARADRATKDILLHLLHTMKRNEQGTLEDSDSEFLHDFRVAIRRTRSALTQIKGVLPSARVEHFKQGFAWLGQLTGPTRDMDVYLLVFDEYQGSLPAGFRNDLLPLRTFLQAHQKKEHGELVKHLCSTRYERLLTDWQGFLEEPVPQRSSLPNALRTVNDLSRERIWRVYRRVLREGQAIHEETPAEFLHELRKTCKKLRYLMEFFQSLYPPAEIKAAIKDLKVLQENLGDFQDLEVQGTSLREFSRQMVEEANVPVDTLLAMGMLVENLERRQQKARQEFSERFHHFSQAASQERFEALFSPKLEAVA